MSGETLSFCFARMPAAIAYQLQLLYYQRNNGARYEKRYEADQDVLTAFFS
jgi:hypothetical protein